jgi:mercuric ion transport protein
MASTSQRLPLIGGVLAALGASACCILPLALVSLGLGGAWLSYARVLEPYRPAFGVLTLGLVAFAFWHLYLRSRPCDVEACEVGPSTRAQLVFWVVSSAALLLFAFPWYANWLIG